MIHTLDGELLGRRGVIATGLIVGTGGVILVDPGPSTSLDGVERAMHPLGFAFDDVRAVLVTHIHLDHSGGVGELVARHPAMRVYVHERGARHIVDPTRLIESATRLYGDRMEMLWGRIVPVPAERVTALAGGERLEVAGRNIAVAYTPGHASHHVSYLDERSGTMFAGDTGGIRIGSRPCVMPPTPPPDIDVVAWQASLAVLRAWQPASIFVTHFGAYPDVAAHLDDLEQRLVAHAALAREILAEAGTDEERQARFAARVTERLAAEFEDAETLARYRLAVPLDHCWQGLARYWRKFA